MHFDWKLTEISIFPLTTDRIWMMNFDSFMLILIDNRISLVFLLLNLQSAYIGNRWDLIFELGKTVDLIVTTMTIQCCFLLLNWFYMSIFIWCWWTIIPSQSLSLSQSSPLSLFPFHLPDFASPLPCLHTHTHTYTYSRALAQTL